MARPLRDTPLVCFVLFVCTYEINQNQYASDLLLGLFGKLSRRRGAWAWFHGVWNGLCSEEVLEY
jgi:hypothetical protein